MTDHSNDLGPLLARLSEAEPLRITGRVCSVAGLVIRALVSGARIGDLVKVDRTNGHLAAEVVGLDGSEVTLLPFGSPRGVGTDSQVSVIPGGLSIPASEALIGRVLDGLGQPIDGLGDLPAGTPWPSSRRPPDPMSRRRIERPFSSGVRAIDGLCTLGEGQRIGVFAGSGVGKSALLGQIARRADADVIVVGLIGERGREVRSFLEDTLGSEGRERSVVVVATSDEPAMVRVKSAHTTTAIAEYFRSQGRRVLLVIDSLTRFARARRDAGLAVGELPSRHGFPPSVFGELPRLVERAGNSAGGVMTAIYSVLVTQDDMNDPVADEARSILDGHIVLSRPLAERGHWPAIDCLASLSRVMQAVTTAPHRDAARQVRAWLAAYEDKRDLIELGLYRHGSDARIDDAIDYYPDIEGFLCQDLDEQADYDEAVARLVRIVRD